MGGCEDTAGGVPDRRQDERECTTLGCENPGTVTGTFHDHDVDYPATYCPECVEAVGDWFEPAAAEPVPGQQREAVADELARHMDTLSYTRDDDTVRLGCRCGHQRSTVTKRELASDLDGRMREHRLHVADAVIGVIEGHRP